MIIDTKSEEVGGGIIESTLLIKGADDHVLEVSLSFERESSRTGRKHGASVGVLFFAPEGIRLNPSQIQTLADYLGVAHLQNERLIYGSDES